MKNCVPLLRSTANKTLCRCTVRIDNICTSWVQVSGTFYRNGMAIATDSNTVDYSFGKIKHIIIRGKHIVSFLYIKLRILCLSRHVHAFEVDETESWGFINVEEIVNHCPRNLHRMANGKLYVPSS